MSIGNIEELKTLFRYNPKTGSLINRRTGRKSGGKNKGSRCNQYYLRTLFNGRKVANHILIWAIQTGKWPEGVIDHIDGNGLNNKWENLRDVPEYINRRNLPRDPRNTSGVPGVTLVGRRYIVRIASERLGSYPCIFEAACARKSAERRQGYHVNHGRI